MDDRDLIEIPLDDRDAKLLPPLYEYFKSFLVRYELGTARPLQQVHSQHTHS